VELALVMPLLLWFALGILDFGRVFYTYIGITNAAREGARCATLSKPGTLCNNVPTCNVANIRTFVKAEQAFLFRANNFNNASYVINVDCSQSDRRSVGIVYQFRPITGLFLFTLADLGGNTDGTIPLSTWATMPLVTS
jgi:hypothetical protein